MEDSIQSRLLFYSDFVELVLYQGLRDPYEEPRSGCHLGTPLGAGLWAVFLAR